MNSDVEKLWELQKVLTQLQERERAMNTKPESFAAIDREFQAASEEKERLTATLEQLARERRRIEGELTDQQELLKKYQGQLMQVKNQQQYAAAWKEIDAARKHAKELEDAALKVMTDAEAVQKQLDEKAAEFEALQSRWQEHHDVWQHSLSDLKQEADSLRQRSTALEAALPEGLRREFQRIYRQRGSVAVTQVANDSCSTCRTRIRPALFQRLKRGELVHCEGCHRILYAERNAS
ncbi:MAG TPA: C4-type zinc ribbon domain-containing protein [Thermoanaerobaculia bacterium]|nr:C4-type zinc ribbon domain-containing protein [Thermoanaerobaculia bacterium]